MKSTHAPHRRELKQIMIGCKIEASLVLHIDRDAERRGVSRSDVMRGILREHYREQLAVGE